MSSRALLSDHIYEVTHSELNAVVRTEKQEKQSLTEDWAWACPPREKKTGLTGADRDWPRLTLFSYSLVRGYPILICLYTNIIHLSYIYIQYIQGSFGISSLRLHSRSADAPPWSSLMVSLSVFLCSCTNQLYYYITIYLYHYISICLYVYIIIYFNSTIERWRN